MYLLAKRFRLKRIWVVFAGVVIVGLFISMSVMLYLDVIRWNIPFVMDMKGSEWMFHTDMTGIDKSDVSQGWVILMFCLYPVWYYLGYLAAQYLSRWYLLENRVYTLSQVKSRDRPRTEAYSVRRGDETRRLLRECLDEIGGIQTFVRSGDKVVIKVNICGGNPKRRGSFTSIEIADELTKLVKDVGAKPFIVDADMIWTEFWPVADAEGYTEWAKRTRTKLWNLSERRRTYLDFEGTLKKTEVSKDMITADVIISVPTMKTHILTGITMGMKNMYGTFPQMDKAVYHKVGIEEVVFEVNKAFSPNLTIIDGSIGGEAMGPLSSKAVDFKTIVASGNVVVADTIACHLIGYEPLKIKHIRLAHEAGLGNAEVIPDLAHLAPQDKDGSWEKPSTNSTEFYNEVLKTVLQLPAMEEFFNVMADFVFYDAATLPLLEDLTPELLSVADDIGDALKRSGRI